MFARTMRRGSKLRDDFEGAEPRCRPFLASAIGSLNSHRALVIATVEYSAGVVTLSPSCRDVAIQGEHKEIYADVVFLREHELAS